MEEQKEKILPKNPPATWWLKHELIDEVGNVFRKGKYVGTKEELENGTIPPLEEKPKDPPKEKPEPKLELKPEPKSDTPKELHKEPAKKETTSNPSENYLATIDRLLGILEKQGKGQPMAQEIAQAIQDVQSGKRIHRGLDTIDPNDILNPPVIISASGSMFAIYDCRAENGEITTNPTGEVIMLNYQGSKKFKTDKEENQRHFCSAAIKSKKVLEWIRKASYYGTIVFENTNEALAMSPNVVQEMAQLWTRVDKMDRQQLITICKEKNPNAGGMPGEQLKHEAARIMADDLIVQRHAAHMEKAKAMAFSELLNTPVK